LEIDKGEKVKTAFIFMSTDRQYRFLTTEKKRLGVSKAEVLRRIFDKYLDIPEQTNSFEGHPPVEHTTLQTAVAGQRTVIDSSDNTLKFYKGKTTNGKAKKDDTGKKAEIQKPVHRVSLLDA